MGAPAENKNAVRHGLTCGKMPPRATYIRAATNELRRVIEQAVIEKHGRIGIYEAAVIQSCVRWERHSLLCTKWLREEYDRLDPEQRLSFSRDAAKASESRDRCLKSLGLDRLENHDDFGRLYSGPVEAAPSHFTGGGDAAPQNGTRAPAGAIVCDLESDGGLTCELPSSAHPNTDAGL